MNAGHNVDDGLLHLGAYLLASARGLLHEPPTYGTNRCMDGARRVLQLLRAQGVLDEKLMAIEHGIETFFNTPMHQDRASTLPDLLDQWCLDLAHIMLASEPKEAV